eukprot:3258030-Pyramimonas_sp.AAC.1
MGGIMLFEYSVLVMLIWRWILERREDPLIASMDVPWLGDNTHIDSILLRGNAPPSPSTVPAYYT